MFNNKFLLKLIVLSFISTIFLSFPLQTINNIYIEKIKKIIISKTAFNSSVNSQSFQQSAIITFNGYQYTAFWNTDKNLCIARRKITSEIFEIIILKEYKSPHDLNDAHYTISLGICPKNGTIHLSFDQHNDTLRYIKSIKYLATSPENFQWNSKLFSPVSKILIDSIITMVTYPRFVIMPDGNLLFECRIGTSGYGNSYLWKYNAELDKWEKIGIYINGTISNENAYLHGIKYDQRGILHITWCWRETPDPSTNQDLCYAYSPDNGISWFDNNGTKVATSGSFKTALNRNIKSLTVWNITKNRGLINQESMAIDSKGRIHVLLSHLNDETNDISNFQEARKKSIVFHYYRDTNGIWKRINLNIPDNNRNQIAIDKNDNLFAILGEGKIYYSNYLNNYNWKLLSYLKNDKKLFGDGSVDEYRLINDEILSVIYCMKNNIFVCYDFIIKDK